MDSFSSATISKKVDGKSSIVKVFGSDKEGSELRISHIKHGSDPTK